MKKILAIVLVLAMMLSLVACSSKSGTEAAVPAENKETEKAPEAEEVEQKGTITFSFFNEVPQAWWDKVKEDTGITVEFEMVASADYANIMSTRVKGGAAPDIFFSRSEDIGKMYAENGYAEPMTQFNELIEEKVSPSVLNIMHQMFGDEIYGIPTNVSYTGIMFYNKDLFAEHGISVPTNMTEFVSVCEKFTELGIMPFINGASETNHIAHFSFCPFMINNLNGQQEWLRGLADGSSSFLDEEWMTAMQYMQDGIAYADPSCIGLTHVEAWAQFAEGASAMFTGSSYMLEQNYAVVPPSFEMGLVACPYNYEGDPYICISGQNNVMMVNSASENKDLAMEYYEYWLNHLEEYAQIVGTAAPFKVEEGVQTVKWADFSEYFDMMATMPAYTQVRLPSVVEADFNAYMQGMIIGDLTVENMSELQGKLEAGIG